VLHIRFKIKLGFSFLLDKNFSKKWDGLADVQMCHSKKLKCIAGGKIFAAIYPLTYKLKTIIMVYLKTSFKNTFTAIIAMSAFAIVSCGNNETKTSGENSDTTATNTNNQTGSESGGTVEAILSGTQPDTAVTGTVRFNEDNGKVKMTLDITVLKKANQSVAVHIHEHGNCGDMGKEAHGHWNQTKANHGKWGSASFHRGDIGNVDLNGEGKGTLELETDLWSISGSDSTKNILNKAIIVHGGVDDFKTQPTGNAGSRIGCGVIKKG